MKRKITLIQILFLCVFIGCGVYLVKYAADKAQTEKEMEYLQSLVKDAERDTPQPEVVTVDLDAPEGTVEEYEENGMLTRYSELYARNSDMVGWIKIDGTNIDYPVMYKADENEYYLKRNFEKEKNSAGIPFMDSQCMLEPWSDNIIIYAHNMRNGTMFHDLLRYGSEGFCENHSIIEFDTLYNRCKYEVFAAFHTAVDAKDEFRYYDFINAASKRDFDSFVSECKSRSLYDTGITPEYGETLLTLSTCSYNVKNERFAVVARQIEKQ